MIALIPMAGAGSRFAEKGYTIPKPLLPMRGKPMVISACNDLPKADKQIFIIREAHDDAHNIKNMLLEHFPEANIIPVDKLTEGQASTCLLAKEFINNNEELVIGASDNGMIWPRENFDKEKETCDAIIFTFRNNPAVLAKPSAYGWVIADENNFVNKVKVKYNMPDPMKAHAVTGAFWFKKGSDFVAAAERMIGQNRRINNEFYVDECLNDCIQLGLKVKVFEIEHYLCWGTPADYETFLYWESFFNDMPFHPYKK
ncbi:MAG: nucleotidyltransferase [Bacteroidia bacterium]|nr:nucleotidyltransferase [Bacteroidia bacterium]